MPSFIELLFIAVKFLRSSVAGQRTTIFLINLKYFRSRCGHLKEFFRRLDRKSAWYAWPSWSVSCAAFKPYILARNAITSNLDLFLHHLMTDVPGYVMMSRLRTEPNSTIVLAGSRASWIAALLTCKTRLLA